MNNIIQVGCIFVGSFILYDIMKYQIYNLLFHNNRETIISEMKIGVKDIINELIKENIVDNNEILSLMIKENVIEIVNKIIETNISANKETLLLTIKQALKNTINESIKSQIGPFKDQFNDLLKWK